jgi:hypothetical protein
VGALHPLLLDATTTAAAAPLRHSHPGQQQQSPQFAAGLSPTYFFLTLPRTAMPAVVTPPVSS